MRRGMERRAGARRLRAAAWCLAGAGLCAAGGCKQMVMLRVVEYQAPAADSGGSPIERQALAFDQLLDGLP